MAGYATTCFICSAERGEDVYGAIGQGWGFAPVLGIAACPDHSITAHQVKLTNICRTPVLRLKIVAVV